MYTARDIEIIEGLDVIRRRPDMFIGPAEPDRSPALRLPNALVDAIASLVPSPQEIRVQLWRKSTITVAWHGTPLPIAPFTPIGRRLPRPAIYELFLCMATGVPSFESFLIGAILNALSERLVVSTVHDGQRYRVAFSKGRLVSLLDIVSCDQPLGTNWLTFNPDIEAIGGDVLTWADMQCLAMRHEGPRICTEDHSEENADWS
jgi:topoisomerase-4 subunit B